MFRLMYFGGNLELDLQHKLGFAIRTGPVGAPIIPLVRQSNLAFAVAVVRPRLRNGSAWVRYASLGPITATSMSR